MVSGVPTEQAASGVIEVEIFGGRDLLEVISVSSVKCSRRSRRAHD